MAEELNRGGQVFFVHNVIYNIGIVHEQLKKMLPDVRIAVAHGKMNEKELERIMLGFIGGEYDLLLSTNIIESGLDISNVNTIFINNAHRFGLADLYQLRGRVGRSAKQSYAYLLVPKEEVLTKDALVRLKILEEMTELGSGLKVANYDLEIRGAGNLLGKEQSGHINLVGFELYCRMLEEAVRELKDEVRPEEEAATEINLPLSAFIPDSYIGDETNKLLTYKRLSKIKTSDELARHGRGAEGPLRPGPDRAREPAADHRSQDPPYRDADEAARMHGKADHHARHRADAAGHEEGPEDGKGGQGADQALARRKDRHPKRPKAGRYRRNCKKCIAGAYGSMI